MVNQTLNLPIKLVDLDEVTSTMDEARKLALTGETNLLVRARTQSLGRGRKGNVWGSEPGNFFGTYIFNLSKESEMGQGLSLVAGLSVMASLALFPDVKLKWPNDLVVESTRQKLAGILIETLQVGSHRVALIGLGINLLPQLEDARGRISLKELGRDNVSLDYVTEVLSQRLTTDMQLFNRSGFVTFRDLWVNCCVHSGRNLTVNQGDELEGGALLDGMFEGIAEDGALILKLGDDGTRVIYSGTVVGW